MDTDDLDLFVLLIDQQAKCESLLTKVAIGCVVRNRVHHTEWPNDYRGVILESEWFALAPIRHRWHDIKWRECRFAAYGVYHNWLRDITNKANHYYHVDHGIPQCVKQQHPVLRLGPYWFYNL